MDLIFAGTPEFAAEALAALIKAGHVVKLVLTQPDRPAGRGLRPRASPVKALARAQGLPLLQPATLAAQEVQEKLKATRAQAMVVAAYGLILPPSVLAIPPLGCLNIHASLLPRWRGAAPIQRALLAGDRETGITIMQMDSGLDTGPILLQERIPIADSDIAQTLHDKLARLGARLIVQAVAAIERGELAAMPQDEALACYAPKIAKTEAVIDWSLSAEEIGRRVRAFNPRPGAVASFQGVPLKVWQAVPVAAAGTPGQVLEASRSGIVVACGRDALRLEVLQKPGGRPLAAAQFLHGFPLRAGERFS